MSTRTRSKSEKGSKEHLVFYSDHFCFLSSSAAAFCVFFLLLLTPRSCGFSFFFSCSFALYFLVACSCVVDDAVAKPTEQLYSVRQ